MLGVGVRVGVRVGWGGEGDGAEQGWDGERADGSELGGAGTVALVIAVPSRQGTHCTSTSRLGIACLVELAFSSFKMGDVLRYSQQL